VVTRKGEGWDWRLEGPNKMILALAPKPYSTKQKMLNAINRILQTCGGGIILEEVQCDNGLIYLFVGCPDSSMEVAL
jgi:hypothetical protein